MEESKTNQNKIIQNQQLVQENFVAPREVQDTYIKTQTLRNSMVERLAEQFLTSKDYRAENYLDLMGNECPLDKIYKVVSIGYKDQSKEICPVLVAIKEEKLRKYYKGNYLLQCWDDQGRIVYQRALEYCHLAWSFSRFKNTFMYVLDRREDSENCFHIVQLNKCDDLSSNNKVEIKIKDWTGLCQQLKSLTQNEQNLISKLRFETKEVFLAITTQNIFVVATQNTLHSVDTSAFFAEAEIKKQKLAFNVDKNLTAVGICENTKKLHQMWDVPTADGSIIGAFGTQQQALLDFNLMNFEIIENQGKQEIITSFCQNYELCERQIKVSPEEKIQQVNLVIVKKEEVYKNVIVVLRSSQNVDFYWNGKLVYASDIDQESIENGNQLFQHSDIHLSFEEIYLKKSINSQTTLLPVEQKFIKVPLSLAENISIESAVQAKDIEPKSVRFFYSKMLHDHYKPFQSFVSYDDYLCVSHGNTISIFNTLSEVWEKHFSFTHNTKNNENLLDQNKTFDFEESNRVISVFQNEYKNKQEIGLFFQDGTFKVLYLDLFDSEWKYKTLRNKTQGIIQSVMRDTEHQRVLMITTKDEASDKISLQCFYQRIANKLTNSEVGESLNMTNFTKVVPFFSPAENTQFLLVNIQEEIIHILDLSFKKNLDDPRGVSPVFNLTMIKCRGLKQLIDKSKIQNAVSTDLTKNLVLFDTEDMHVVDMTTYNPVNQTVSKITTHNFMLIQGVHFFNNQFLYVLYNNKIDLDKKQQQNFAATQFNSNGFGILDLNCLNNSADALPLLLPICDAIVGINNELVYCPSADRIAFLQDYDKLQRVPLMHLNTVKFEGIRSRRDYLAFQTINDSLFALDNKNYLRQWSLYTGQQKMQPKKIKNHDFTGYQTWTSPMNPQYQDRENNQNENDFHRCGHFKQVLIYKTQPEKNIKALEFYKKQKTISDFDTSLGKSFQEQFNQTFHRMKLIIINDQFQVTQLSEFIHFRLLDHEQHLFFSSDGQKMLEIDNGDCKLYEYNLNQDFLQLKYRLRKIPKHLANGNCFQIYSLFSPDFLNYLDFDIQDQEFVIRDIAQGNIKFRLPRKFLEVPNNSKNIAEQLKFIKWEDNETLRILDIDHDEPFEKIIKISQLDINLNQSFIEEVASITVPFFDKSSYILELGQSLSVPTLGGNFFAQGTKLNVYQTTERLKRKHQNLKRLWYIDQDFLNAENQPLNTENPKIDIRRMMLTECLFEVDYKQDDQVLLDLPFTFFHWRLIEFVTQVFSKYETQSSRMDSLKSFQPYWAKDMTLNLLPALQTLLHQSANQIELLEFIQQQIIRSDQQSTKKFEVPFIQDYFKNTPLHLNFQGQRKNVQAAAFFLQVLKSTSIDHHGKAIADIIFQCLENQVQGTTEYLQSRLLTTSQYKKFNQVPNSKLKTQSNEEEDNFFVTSLEIQPDQFKLHQKLFDTDESESNVEIKVLDIPYIHNPDRPESKSFCKALYKAFDQELFQQECVRGIIAYRWPITQQTIIFRLFIPYFAYGVLFFWFLFDVKKQTDLDATNLKMNKTLLSIVTLVLVFFSLYFLWQEFKQSNESLIQYLQSPWNYLDFVPPTLILITTSIDYAIPDSDESQIMMTVKNTSYAIIALMLCMKMFYFLRIYRKTGYFVSMLVSVVSDARYFFLLYFLIHLAFFSSFKILTNGQYTLFTVFLLGAGDYNYDGWDQLTSPTTMVIFFVLSVFLIQIVMLNILIAIVGSTYQRVIETQKQFSDLERLSLILENSEFVSKQAAQDLNSSNEYLVIAQIANQTK